MSQTFIPLENVRIASSCHAHWDAMDGNERSRYCGSCAKQVYNLSAMTRFDAEELIAEKEGNLCVRYYQRADGTIMTQDCPVGLAKVRRLALMPLGWVAAAIATFAAWSVVAPKATMGAPEIVTGDAAILPPKAVPTAPRHSLAAKKKLSSRPAAKPKRNPKFEVLDMTMGEMTTYAYAEQEARRAAVAQRRTLLKAQRALTDAHRNVSVSENQ